MILRLLGPPRLETSSASLGLNRRMAGAFAYLALEGATHKYKLAGLLWPDTEEFTARNNMRQLLRRVRTGLHDIVTGEDMIELRPELEVDVRKLTYLEMPPLRFLRDHLELLEGFEFDDTNDFAEWLVGARAELRDLRSRSARREVERLTHTAQYAEALEYAQVWVRLEPLSEEAYRHAMRLQYLMGDRGAALGSFEQLKNLLRVELGVEPLPESLELARLIERGAVLPGEAPPPKANLLPTAVLRPPVLVGREREWAEMEEAWQRRQIILVCGEPGAGKSRLVEEFVSSKGRFVHNDGRPGDASIPYATVTRNLREFLALRPEVNPRSGHLEPWVWNELARLMPELGVPAPSLDGAKLRLFEAITVLYNTLARGLAAIIIDDLQFYDDISLEASSYARRAGPTADPDEPRYIGTFRRGELSPTAQELIEQLVQGGVIKLIELEPLPPEAVDALLQGMGIEDAAHLVQGLSRYTGGNPLFVLETLKHLIETNALSEGLPARLTPRGRVAVLLGQRLERLSPAALSLARAAAVAGTAFHLKLAAVVLERSALELAGAHAELEAAQVLHGNAFTHDLLYEATLAGTPKAVAQVLNARIAAVLEEQRANAALVAQHWLEADEPERAAQWWLRAADEARALGLFAEAVRLYERVQQCSTDPLRRLEAETGLTYPLVALGRLAEAENLARTVLYQTTDSRVRVKALDALQTVLMWQGSHTEAEAAIAEAQQLAETLGDETLTDEMRFSHGFILARLGRDAEAASILEPLLPRYRQRPLGFERLHLLSALGGIYGDLGRYAEAKALLHEALAGAKQIGSHSNQILAANDLQYTHNIEGTPAEGLAHTLEALALGDYVVSESLRAKLAHAYLLLGRDEEAAEQLEVLVQGAQDPNTLGSAWARLIQARARLGHDHREARIRAIEAYTRLEVPSAQLVVLAALMAHGDPQEHAWAAAQLRALDSRRLSPIQRAEYERLQRLG